MSGDLGLGEFISCAVRIFHITDTLTEIENELIP